MKKIVSNLLKILLPKNVYYNRRDNYFFILYSQLELFFKTFKLRFLNIKHIFLPSKHIGAIFILNKLSKFLKKEKISFFLWDACLLGVARNQNAIAGTASDIDLGVIFEKDKHLKILLSLKKDFKIKFHNNYNAIQLFHTFGTVDISLFKKKNSNLIIIYDVAIAKETNTYNKKNYIKKKIYFKISDFIPFQVGRLYSKKYLIPKNFIFLLIKKYGSKWSQPHKKRQVYFN